MIVLKTVFERSVFDIRRIEAVMKDSKSGKKIFEYQRSWQSMTLLSICEQKKY